MNDVRLFWNTFMDAHEHYVKAGQEVIEKHLRKKLDSILIQYGLDPDDVRIVWKRPEIEISFREEES